MSMTLAGVMGPGEDATAEDLRVARELGGLIAREGWVLVTGGRHIGVMDAASRGAKAAQGLVVGILPGLDDNDMSPAVDIPIITGMNEARNCINVLSSRVLFFVGMSPGTAAELALAMKSRRHIILVAAPEDIARVFGAMSSVPLVTAADAASAVASAKRMLEVNGSQ
jgi:uncharacterized protein (TIGR00725 family)